MAIDPVPMRTTRLPQPKKTSALGVVLGIAAAIGGGALVRTAMKDRGAGTASSSAWHQVALGDVRFDAPFDLPPLSDMSSSLPEEVRTSIASARMSQAQSSDDKFGLVVSEMTTLPDTPGSVEGAIQGAISNAARALGSDVVTVPTTPVQVSGLSGYRASHTVTRREPAIHLTGVSVMRDRMLWCVVVMYAGDRAGDDAKRILDSVQIAPAAATGR